MIHVVLPEGLALRAVAISRKSQRPQLVSLTTPASFAHFGADREPVPRFDTPAWATASMGNAATFRLVKMRHQATIFFGSESGRADVSHVRNEFAGGGTPKLSEIANHVHLVVVAEAVGLREEASLRQVCLSGRRNCLKRSERYELRNSSGPWVDLRSEWHGQKMGVVAGLLPPTLR